MKPWEEYAAVAEQTGVKPWEEYSQAQAGPEPEQAPAVPPITPTKNMREGLALWKLRRDRLNQQPNATRAEHQVPIENAIGGFTARAKDLGNKLLPGDPFGGGKEAIQERYGSERDTLAGKVGAGAADEVALLPVGLVGKGLQGTKAAITGGRAAKNALTKAIQSRSPVAAANKAEAAASSGRRLLKENAGDLANWQKEQKRIQDRLLGRHIDDPKAWLAEQNVKLSDEVAKGVPDLRDTRKFEMNIANDFNTANEKLAGAQLFKKSAERSVAKQERLVNAAKNSPGYNKLQATAGLLGSHTARGATEGAVGAALLAEPGDADLAAVAGGLLGGSLGGVSDVSNAVAKGAGKLIGVPTRMGARGLAITLDGVNKRWRKYIGNRQGLTGLQLPNEAYTRIFSKKRLDQLASGELSAEKLAEMLTSHHNINDPGVTGALASELRKFIVAEFGANAAEALNEEE